MSVIVAPEEALQYMNQWVAFSIDLKRVVGHGSTSLDAQEMAYSAGEPHAVLFFMADEEHFG